MAKKTTAKKVGTARKSASAKKATAAKKFSARKAAAKKVIATAPSGYAANATGGIFVPQDTVKSSVTSASKLREGMAKAQTEIRESLQEIAATLSMDFEISEIELSISFNADGKFLGFGVGGATSLKIKIKPSE
jgi:hypothetical protein